MSGLAARGSILCGQMKVMNNQLEHFVGIAAMTGLICRFNATCSYGATYYYEYQGDRYDPNNVEADIMLGLLAVDVTRFLNISAADERSSIYPLLDQALAEGN